MPNYRAPLQDMQFVITELAGLERLAALPGYEEVTPDLVEAVHRGGCKARRRRAGTPQPPPATNRGAALDKGRRRRGRRVCGGVPSGLSKTAGNGLSGDPEYGGHRAAWADCRRDRRDV